MQLEDYGSTATLTRLESTLSLCFNALSQGVASAEAMHAKQRWDPRADPHMFSHVVRREALEVIKEQDPNARAEDSLGGAMSSLHLCVDDTDELRVWHSSQGQVRLPSSEAGRVFLQQPSSALYLPVFEPIVMPSVCRTVLLWEQKNGELTRFTLVRPIGYHAGKVLVDWEEPLLERFSQRIDDVVYRRRESADGQDAQTS